MPVWTRSPAGNAASARTSPLARPRVQSELGHQEHALATADEAVSIRRRLAEGNPEAYLPDLGMSLGAYAQVCVNVRANLPRALTAITEAINIYKRLAQQVPEKFSRYLYAAFRTCAGVLDGMGQTADAAELRRRLDRASQRA